MTSCCSPSCAAARRHFGSDIAARDVARYRKAGPGATARLLQELVVASGPAGRTLLDVGAGVGVLTFELLQAGFLRATAVDAAPAYVAAGVLEAERLSLTDRVDWREGDFVDLAPSLPPADVLTLDRVACCYPAVGPLLDAAADKARVVGLSYPRDRWFVRGATAFENALRRLRGNPFRTFVHPPAGMAARLHARGFRLTGRRKTLIWTVDLYTKNGAR